MSERLNGVGRHIVVLAGAVASGYLASWALPAMTSARGVSGPLITQAQSPGLAILITLLCVAGCTALGAIIGKLTNAAVGLFILGCGFYVLAFRSGTLQDLVYGGGTLSQAAIETAAWGVVVLICTIVIFLVSGSLKDMHPAEGEPAGWFSVDALISAALGLLSLPAVWLIARNPAKGQVLLAAILGALAAGMVARLFRAHVQPVLLFAVPCLVGAAGHVIGMWLLKGPAGADGLAQAVASNSLNPLSGVMPLDYAAGSVLGVSVGLGWARSFLQPESQSASTANIEIRRTTAAR